MGAVGGVAGGSAGGELEDRRSRWRFSNSEPEEELSVYSKQQMNDQEQEHDGAVYTKQEHQIMEMYI